MITEMQISKTNKRQNKYMKPDKTEKRKLNKENEDKIEWKGDGKRDGSKGTIKQHQDIKEYAKYDIADKKKGSEDNKIKKYKGMREKKNVKSEIKR